MPRSVRARALACAFLVLVSAFPILVAQAQTEEARDFRIMGVRATTRNDTGYVQHGWFPKNALDETGNLAEIAVRVQVFQSGAPGASPVDFTGPFRILFQRLDGTTGQFAQNGCIQGTINIPASGREFSLAYTVPGTEPDGRIDLNVTINKRCTPGDTAYTPHPESTDSEKRNNYRRVSLVLSETLDWAVRDTKCETLYDDDGDPTTREACGQHKGGPGSVADPETATGVDRVESAVRMCQDGRSVGDPWSEECTPAGAWLNIYNNKGGERDVYFRVNVSNYGQWGNGAGEFVQEPQQSVPDTLASNHSTLCVDRPEYCRQNERYVVYPPYGNEPAQPMEVPIRLAVYKVTTDEAEQKHYKHLQDLTLADYQGNAIQNNCTIDKDKLCVKHVEKWKPDGTKVSWFSPVWTSEFDLNGKGGDFVLRVTLNPNCGKRDYTSPGAPDRTCANNEYEYPFTIEAPDLVTELTGVTCDSDPCKVGDIITFTGTIRNQGTLASELAITSVGDGTGVLFEVEGTGIVLDDATNPDKMDLDGPRDSEPGCGFLGPGETCDVTVRFTLAGRSSPNYYAPPGTRVAKLTVDPPSGGNLLEKNEDNNDDTVTFLVEDKEAPTVSDLRVYNSRDLRVPGTPAEVARGERLNLTVVVTDSDHAITDVVANLTKPDGTPWNCGGSCKMNRTSIAGDAQFYELELEKGLLEEGEWKYKVAATDPSGNKGESSTKTIKVRAWPKTAAWRYADAPEGGVYRPGGTLLDPQEGDLTGTPANGSALAYTPAGWTIDAWWRLPKTDTDDRRNDTGHAPRWTSAGQMLRIHYPNGNETRYTVEDDEVLVVKRHNGEVIRYGMGNKGIEGPVNFSMANFASCEKPLDDGTCDQYADDELWGFPINLRAHEIGVYNLYLNVSDVGGENRTYHTWFRVRDELPHGNVTMRGGSSPNANVDNVTNVVAGTTEKFRVTAYDDQGYTGNGTVYLNFTHVATGHHVNTTMSRVWDECPFEEGEYRCLFEKAVKVAKKRDGGVLNLSGRWDLEVLFRDKNGNFNNTTQQTSVSGVEIGPAFTYVHDTTAPSVPAGAFGTTQPEEEIDANVTFWARPVDDLDVKAYIVIKRGSVVLVDAEPMASDGKGNFTYVRKFADEGVYEYQVYVEDFNATRTRVSSIAKSITISQNLPPRVDVGIPSVPGHGYFAKAAPVLEFTVYDTAQGVKPTSVKLVVDGVNVTGIERTPTADGTGYTVRYTHDASKAFAHGKNVTFALYAEDLSTPALGKWTNESFTVDAIPPKSKVVSFDPRYAFDDGDLWNVSLATAFTPASDDGDDGLPTGVAKIQYQFLRNGPGPLFTYNGTPFLMGELPASMNVGNDEYSIRILGTDVVGNTEAASAANTLRVYLDQVPPELVHSKLKNTGRLVNATFSDPASGTKSARVHYRYDAGAFAVLDMVRQKDGTWTATIPVHTEASTVSYYLEATDNVGNRKQFGDELSPPWSFPIGNRPPALTITAPEDGARVSGSVTLRWEASDPDGDPLTYKVYYKAATGRDELDLATLQSTSSYVLDTTKLGADGLYDFRVTASDGHFFEEDTIRLEVANSKSVVDKADVDKRQISPGETVCYTARVTKSDVSVVEARVFRGDERVAVVPLNDAGTNCDVTPGDGIWAGTLTLDRAGEYEIEVAVRYVEGGEVKEASSRQGAVRVKLSAIDIPRENPGLVAAVAFVAVSVLAVGAYGAFRRWGK